jgi:lysylphosphatidylglycerol synthetase-like protein (DUF2156 family)
VPAVTLAVVALLATLAMLAAGLAFRQGGARAWNAVGVFAIGGVVCGYGLLIELMGEDAVPAVLAGGLVSLSALGYLGVRAR